LKNLERQTRPLLEKEIRALKKMRSVAEKELQQAYRYRSIIIALAIAAGCTFLAVWAPYQILVLLFGTIAVLAFGWVLFMPFEIYKDVKKRKARINEVSRALERGTVDVFPMTAKQFALAKEYEDEGDLYIIEMNDGRILYIWDDDYNLKKNFPAHSFELYDEEFSMVIGRRLNPLSEKVNPILIDAKAKWAYFEKTEGAPENMTFEKKDFSKLVSAMSAAISGKR
jgi:hypothetical protein